MKNKQAIYLLFAANSISGFAQGISMIAIPWYYTVIYGKASEFGLIYFALTGLSLFWGLYAGTMIDKYDRKKIFLVSSLCGFMIVLGVAIFGFSFGTIPAILIALVFGVTVFIYNIHYPNLYAFAQEITDPKDYGRITSYIEVQGQLTTAISGALAAILLTGSSDGIINLLGFNIQFPIDFKQWQLQEIFLMDASTYIVAIILIYFIRYRSISERILDTGGILERVKAGFHFLKTHPLIFIFGNASFSIFVTILVTAFYLLPIYVKDHLEAGAGVYASSEIYFALGSIFAGAGIRWLFKKANTVQSIIIVFIVGSITFYLCMVITIVPLFYLLFLIMGFCNAGTRVLRMTYLFNHIPNTIIGRTNSVFGLINVLFRSTFIGIFAIPFFTNDGNIIFTFMILGTFILVAAVILMAYYRRLSD